MKKMLMGAAMLLIGATNAFASDRGLSGSAVPNWLGVYVGAAVSWDRIRADDRDYGSPTSDRGIGGALYITTNILNTNGFVVGVESDLKIGGAEVNDGEYLLPLEQRFGTSTRLRLGYALANFLPFISAGVAIGEFKADHEGNGDSEDTEKFRRIGFVWGAGVDWALRPNFIVRAEYLRSDFGTRDINFYDGSDTHSVKIEVEEFRFGGAYKF